MANETIGLAVILSATASALESQSDTNRHTPQPPIRGNAKRASASGQPQPCHPVSWPPPHRTPKNWQIWTPAHDPPTQ